MRMRFRTEQDESSDRLADVPSGHNLGTAANHRLLIRAEVNQAGEVFNRVDRAERDDLLGVPA